MVPKWTCLTVLLMPAMPAALARSGRDTEVPASVDDIDKRCVAMARG